MDLANRLEKVKEITLSAAKIIMKYYDADKQIEHKGDVNLLTVADTQCEEFLIQSLQKEFPQDSLLAEEGHDIKGSSPYTWVIDPIDGTTSYAHGYPVFGISIGLINEKNDPVLGVVYNPYYKEMYTATLGGGAKLNEKPLKVSSIKTLKRSLLVTGFPYNRRERMLPLMQRLATILHHVHDIRRTGSAALDICSVAAGQADGYFEENLKPWDVAAALLILKEAGGEISNFKGLETDIFKGEFCVSNGLIHKELITLLENAHTNPIQ